MSHLYWKWVVPLNTALWRHKGKQHTTARGSHCHRLTHITALLVLSFSYAQCLQVFHVLGFKLHNPLLCDLIEWKSFPLVMERFRTLQKTQILLILCNMLFPWGEYWDFNGKIILTQNLILFNFYFALRSYMNVFSMNVDHVGYLL